MINAGTQLESSKYLVEAAVVIIILIVIFCRVETKMAAACLCRKDAVTSCREGLYIQISLN